MVILMTFSKVIIDGDQMIYACGFASDGEPVSHSCRLLKNKIEQILTDTKCDNYHLVIEGKGNFREEIDFDYKANRTSRKPENFDAMKEYLQGVWNADLAEGMETDDVVSMELWKDFVANGGDKDKCSYVLSSPDKDLNNTPGWHYNPRTRETYWINELQAERHLWYQMLCGDSTDNIKGLPYCALSTRDKWGLSRQSAKGCGAGSAKKIMAAEDHKKAVTEAYIHYGLEGAVVEPDELYCYMFDQYRLLSMVKEVDEFDYPLYDFMSYDDFEEMYNECKEHYVQDTE